MRGHICHLVTGCLRCPRDCTPGGPRTRRTGAPEGPGAVDPKRSAGRGRRRFSSGPPVGAARGAGGPQPSLYRAARRDLEADGWHRHPCAPGVAKAPAMDGPTERRLNQVVRQVGSSNSARSTLCDPGTRKDEHVNLHGKQTKAVCANRSYRHVAMHGLPFLLPLLTMACTGPRGLRSRNRSRAGVCYVFRPTGPTKRRRAGRKHVPDPLESG